MQFSTLALTLAAGSTALAATCSSTPSTTGLAGTTCPSSTISAAVWYEKKADCGSAATVTYEDARGGSNPVPASIQLANTSGKSLRVYWQEVAFGPEVVYYVDLAAGASCDKTLSTGLIVGGVSYQ